MAEPIIAATQIFDHIQLPESPQVKEHLDVLLDHYDAKGFLALGGTRSEVHREWTRLNTLILRDDILRTLPLHVLYARLFLHFTASHQNVLLLAALVQALAIDAALAERGTSMLRALRAEGPGYKSSMASLHAGPRLEKRYGGRSRRTRCRCTDPCQCMG